MGGRQKPLRLFVLQELTRRTRLEEVVLMVYDYEKPKLGQESITCVATRALEV